MHSFSALEALDAHCVCMYVLMFYMYINFTDVSNGAIIIAI